MSLISGRNAETNEKLAKIFEHGTDAIKAGNMAALLGVLQQLGHFGVGINERMPRQPTLLGSAVLLGAFEPAALLLLHGADPDVDIVPWHVHPGTPQASIRANVLNELMHQPSYPWNQYRWALVNAGRAAHPTAHDVPVVHGTFTGPHGRSMLMYAAEYGHFYGVMWLLATHAADPHAKDGRGWNAVDYAVHGQYAGLPVSDSHMEIARHLVMDLHVQHNVTDWRWENFTKWLAHRAGQHGMLPLQHGGLHPFPPPRPGAPHPRPRR